ncbi:MAG: hypothetical protein AAF936_17555 [Pseudomonadota bacterium]
MGKQRIQQPGILIDADVVVMQPEETRGYDFEGIKRGMRPSLFVDGLHYISIIQECNNLIVPGASGKITILMPTDALLQTDVTVGSRVEVRSGASVIAIAEVLSLKRVFVRSDSSDERGYVIFEEEEGSD